MTVTRVVQIQSKDSVDAETRDTTLRNVLAMKANCLSQETGEPYIHSILIGKDISPEPLNNEFTHQFLLEISNEADRDYYASQDPAHQMVIEGLKPVIEKIQIMDIIDGQY
ncbi:hypothetical protein BJX64DRAFT_269475 [Aspergillus heterothallicus]